MEEENNSIDRMKKYLKLKEIERNDKSHEIIDQIYDEVKSKSKERETDGR